MRWPWPNDHDTQTWPRYGQDVPSYQKWSFYVNWFKSYSLNRQTDTTKTLPLPHTREVTILAYLYVYSRSARRWCCSEWHCTMAYWALVEDFYARCVGKNKDVLIIMLHTWMSTNEFVFHKIQFSNPIFSCRVGTDHVRQCCLYYCGLYVFTCYVFQTNPFIVSVTSVY